MSSQIDGYTPIDDSHQEYSIEPRRLSDGEPIESFEDEGAERREEEEE
jgi:hypothetical protein